MGVDVRLAESELDGANHDDVVVFLFLVVSSSELGASAAFAAASPRSRASASSPRPVRRSGRSRRAQNATRELERAARSASVDETSLGRICVTQEKVVTHQPPSDARARTRTMSGTAAPLVASPFRGSAAITRRRASRPGCTAGRYAGRGSALTTRARQTCYMDIEIGGEAAGRLTFLMSPDLCPRTVDNFVRLCKGSDAGVDPKLTYAGCRFEAYSGKYTYTCKGNGKHVFGAGKFVEREAMSATRRGTPGAGGGTYYGEEVDLLEDESGVVLTIPVSGPGFGASRFAVVRVGESPGSLKQRLLANTMVIGRCADDASRETLRRMTVADAAATIVACGETTP